MKNIIIAGLLLSSGLLSAQVDRSQKPAPAQAKKININDSQIFTTANGITVILSEDHKLPRVTFELSMCSSPRI